MGDLRGKRFSLKMGLERAICKFESALNGYLPQFLALLGDPSLS